MWNVLAQSDESALFNLFETVVKIFSRTDVLAHPELLIEQLQALSLIWAVTFLAAGVLCLFRGYQFHRPVTIVLAGLIGLFGGYWLGLQIEAPYIVAGCLALLMAVLSLSLLKYAVAVFGGLTGAFIGANLWTGLVQALHQAGYVQTPLDAPWIGALLGLIICGLLAFAVFKVSVLLFTSVSGATIAVLGGIALLLSFEPWRAPVADSLSASQMVIPLLVVVPAVIGLIMQQLYGPGEAAPAEK